MPNESGRRAPWLGVMACMLICAWSAGSVAGPYQDAPAPPETKVVPATYSIDVDGEAKNGPLDTALEFDCEHAEGKQHKVTASLIDPQRHDAPGCSFAYPPDARLTRTDGETWSLLTLTYAEGGAVQIEIREEPAQDANSALSAAVQAWVTSYKAAGLKGARTRKLKRQLAGEQIGVAVTGKFVGPAQLCEIYVLTVGTRQIVCTFEWDEDMGAAAPPIFDTFADLFRMLE
jgi:hypothetical protein